MGLDEIVSCSIVLQINSNSNGRFLRTVLTIRDSLQANHAVIIEGKSSFEIVVITEFRVHAVVICIDGSISNR